MPRIRPLQREALADHEPLFQQIEQHLGVLPNSTLTMGHRPPVMRAFAQLNEAVMGEGTVDPGLKQLVALMASTAAGCNYCQAHTAHVGHRRGVSERKLAAVYEFESSDEYDEAERAALRVARGAGRVPNDVTDEQMAELRRHFDDGQCVEIVAVTAVFGYLNRWNDTLSTTLEQSPLAFADAQLSSAGWDAGTHRDAHADDAGGGAA